MIDPKDKKPELDWTDDEFYESAWSWVDESELVEESVTKEQLVDLEKFADRADKWEHNPDMQTPDHWVVLKIPTDDDPMYKVLAGWSGGYLDGDSWRLNSGITLIFEREDSVDFYGNSGSLYHCRKGSYGLAMSTAGIYEQLSSKVELMPEDTDWKNLL